MNDEMASCVNGKDWDLEGFSDFSDFPSDQFDDAKSQESESWSPTWMDEDDRQDFHQQLQKELEQMATSKPDFDLPKLESHTAKFEWTNAANETLELRKTMEMVKRVIEDKDLEQNRSQ